MVKITFTFGNHCHVLWYYFILWIQRHVICKRKTDYPNWLHFCFRAPWCVHLCLKSLFICKYSAKFTFQTLACQLPEVWTGREKLYLRTISFNLLLYLLLLLSSWFHILKGENIASRKLQGHSEVRSMNRHFYEKKNLFHCTWWITNVLVTCNFSLIFSFMYIFAFIKHKNKSILNQGDFSNLQIYNYVYFDILLRYW